MNRSRQRAALLLLIFGSGATEQAAQAEPLDHFATTDDVGLNKVPHTGESHVLVVPHRSGKSEFPATRLADLQRIFNPAGGPGTFRDFWRTTSNGRYGRFRSVEKTGCSAGPSSVPSTSASSRA